MTDSSTSIQNHAHRDLRILHVEDSADDGEVMTAFLRRKMPEASVRQVTTEDDLRSALREQKWNLILSDFNLPQFDGFDVIQIRDQISPAVPLIVVSGAVGEDTAARLIRKGAYDFVSKGSIERLVLSIDRALQDALLKEKQKIAEENLKKSQDQLMAVQRLEAVGQLAGGIAHDFNNLISTILGYCQFLMESVPDDSVQKGDLLEIKQAGERAADLTRQLLTFSRRQVVQPRIVNLNNIIHDMAKIINRTIGENISLSLKLDPHLYPVYADPGSIEQAILNLAINARDAMPRGGRLIIESQNFLFERDHPHDDFILPAGQYAHLLISDTGMGIPRESQRKIFEPFFTTKKPGKGTGLGLSMVYGIVKQIGGYIWVYSEVEKGTVFKLYLPKAKKTDIKIEEPVEINVPTDGSETLLVVEDDESLRRFTLRTLKGKGYRVMEATNGSDALNVLKTSSEKIDLVLSDVIMPEMDGGEMMNKINETHPGLRILFMSGYPIEVIDEHGVLKEGINLIQKPFSPDQLLKRIREVLNSPA